MILVAERLKMIFTIFRTWLISWLVQILVSTKKYEFNVKNDFNIKLLNFLLQKHKAIASKRKILSVSKYFYKLYQDFPTQQIQFSQKMDLWLFLKLKLIF